MVRTICLAVLAVLTLAIPSFAQSETQPVLTVLGKGTYEARPEEAGFRATVSTDGRTLDAATKQHEERASRALKALQGLQADGLTIEKSNFRVNERRVPRQLTPAEVTQGRRPESLVEGYTAVTTFSVGMSSLDKLNQSISKLAETGLFEISSVQFYVRNERAALNQARRAAMLDAREQAQAYAEPVNLKLGQIIAITDGEARPIDGMADLPLRRADGPYTVQIVPPATLEFSASVNVTWRIGENEK
ncbi:SIMPL domain-containing protein [Microvirga sp. BT290]|uniref:SIMPL domain-containing protein n=1 Tax=Microvirga terrestris TaxID=2791024 RepID=A0ABS0HT09_9HYPH|nr:SIMPL domain-containing protein [Microvirga terrestris]